MIFRGDIVIKGKHAGFLRALSQERNENNENAIKLFDTYLTAYFSAAVFGAINGVKAESDQNRDISEAKIYENAIASNSDFCDLCYRLVMIMDSRAIPNQQKQNNAFIVGFDGNETLGFNANKQEFYSYARGGLEYMHKQLTKKDDLTVQELYTHFTGFVNELGEQAKNSSTTLL